MLLWISRRLWSTQLPVLVLLTNLSHRDPLPSPRVAVIIPSIPSQHLSLVEGSSMHFLKCGWAAVLFFCMNQLFSVCEVSIPVPIFLNRCYFSLLPPQTLKWFGLKCTLKALWKTGVCPCTPRRVACVGIWSTLLAIFSLWALCS